MKKYIVKPDTWFKEGTEVILIDDYRPKMNCGLFSGITICENPSSEGMFRNIGEEYEDEEVCDFNEFEEIET